eukprot:gene4792-9550_t
MPRNLKSHSWGTQDCFKLYEFLEAKSDLLDKLKVIDGEDLDAINDTLLKKFISSSISRKRLLAKWDVARFHDPEYIFGVGSEIRTAINEKRNYIIQMSGLQYIPSADIESYNEDVSMNQCDSFTLQLSDWISSDDGELEKKDDGRLVWSLYLSSSVIPAKTMRDQHLHISFHSPQQRNMLRVSCSLLYLCSRLNKQTRVVFPARGKDGGLLGYVSITCVLEPDVEQSDDSPRPAVSYPPVKLESKGHGDGSDEVSDEEYDDNYDIEKDDNDNGGSIQDEEISEHDSFQDKSIAESVDTDGQSPLRRRNQESANSIP